MQTVAEVLKGAIRQLAGHSESPRLDAELLLCKMLGLSRAGLIVRGEAPLPASTNAAYQALLAGRIGGAPIAYLTGEREFWSLPLRVTADVLVPRPETETLVERALELLPPDEPRAVLDLGTGSGAIALAIASERPRARITAIDISAAALDVAAANARELGLLQIEWRSGSWFAEVPGERFDLIVANPPYLSDTDPALVRLAAEPAVALASGPTGLESLTAIAKSAPAHLSAQGWLLLEHGSMQAGEVARLLEDSGFTGIRSHADAAGLARLTLGTLSPGTLSPGTLSPATFSSSN
jgi:release factor glutamine methyltransferase